MPPAPKQRGALVPAILRMIAFFANAFLISGGILAALVVRNADAHTDAIRTAVVIYLLFASVGSVNAIAVRIASHREDLRRWCRIAVTALCAAMLALILFASARSVALNAAELGVAISVIVAGAAGVFLAPRRSRPGHCAACGYDLRGITGPCPECGTEAQ